MTEKPDWLPDTKFQATRRYELYLRHFRSNMPLKRHRRQFTNIDESFTGQEATDFLCSTLPSLHDRGQDLTRENCVRFLQFLMTKKVFGEAKGDSIKFKDNNNVYKFLIGPQDIPHVPRRTRRSASCTGVRVYQQTQKPNEVLILPAEPQSPHFGKIDIDQYAPTPTPQNGRRLSRSYGNLQCHVNNGFADDWIPKLDAQSENIQTPKREVCIHPSGINSVGRSQEKEEKENLYDWLPFQKRKKKAVPVKSSSEREKARRSMSMDRNHLRLSVRQHLNNEQNQKANDDTILSQPMLIRSRIYESMKFNHKRSSQRVVPARPDVTCKNLLLKRFDTVMPDATKTEWKLYVNGKDAEWNCLNVGQMGVVKPRSPQDTQDYPSTMVKLMTFLEHFPVANVNVIAYQNGQEINMFNTLCERLPDVGPVLNQREVDALLEVCFTVSGKKEMMTCRRRVSVMRQSMGRMFSSQTNLQQTYSNTLEVPSPGGPINSRGLVTEGLEGNLQIGFPIDDANRLSRSNSDAQYLQMIPNVYDEADYRIDCPNTIAAINMIMLGLPTVRRRRLHRFIRFIRNIVRNHCLRLEEHSKGLDTNWKAAVNGLWKGVCDPEPEAQESPTDVAAKGILLTAILTANERFIFVPDPIFMAEVQRVVLNRSSTKTNTEKTDDFQPTALQMMQEIEKGQMTDGERKKALKKLKKSYPDVYSDNYADEERGILQRIFKR